jgi:plastocyanin
MMDNQESKVQKPSSLKILIAFAIAILVGFFLFRSRSGSNQPISPTATTTTNYTDQGYEPNHLVVKKGDTVNFVNQTDGFFWPASNLHPSHLIYSEFDPKQPIAVGETWSFTFDQVGEWQFHDHLAPYFTGTITVEE